MPPLAITRRATRRDARRHDTMRAGRHRGGGRVMTPAGPVRGRDRHGRGQDARGRRRSRGPGRRRAGGSACSSRWPRGRAPRRTALAMRRRRRPDRGGRRRRSPLERVAPIVFEEPLAPPRRGPAAGDAARAGRGRAGRRRGARLVGRAGRGDGRRGGRRAALPAGRGDDGGRPGRPRSTIRWWSWPGAGWGR